MFNLFKKKKETPKDNDKYLSLKIREIKKETPDTISLYFEQPDPFLDYKAGQFLTLLLDIEGKPVRRSYSICTSPYLDPFPGITVKRVAGGLVSNYLIEKMKPGKTIEVMKPMGTFTTTFHSKNQNHFILITGGSGITPIMGIMKSVLINEPLSKVSLLYCSRSEGQIIFDKELKELQREYKDRLQIVHNLTQPSPEWKGLQGRLSSQVIEDHLDKWTVETAFTPKYFICGPQGLMETAEQTLLKRGVSKEIIQKESFYITPAANTENESGIPVLTKEVTVILEGHEFHFEVPPGKTILEAGLDEDVDMPYSCQSGLCTACRGRLISGEVKMNEDAGLSESEIQQGYILCCSSKPANGVIRINIE
ncbi:ferredoxin--NADP reductase [Pararhodonellum marinum]|uniref:ferredoxin--NADP reductase n=1 Tax=Pararhodonellum marinum TaxID=2755358 RepID=UPI00188F4908|nr:ferredoxin--NADP reductase [Pararhodonellum marinum]